MPSGSLSITISPTAPSVQRPVASMPTDCPSEIEMPLFCQPRAAATSNRSPPRIDRPADQSIADRAKS